MMSIEDRIRKTWNSVFMHNLGWLGEDKAEAEANKATAELRALLKRVERAQAPQTPRHQNLAGRRQWAANRA
jgi:hypothetical protein